MRGCLEGDGHLSTSDVHHKRGLSTEVQSNSSPISRAAVLVFIPGTDKARGSYTGGKRSVIKRGSGGGLQQNTRLLQPVVSETQETGNLETNNRSLSSKQNSQKRQIQDGDDCIRSPICQTRGMVNKHRPYRCLFPCAGSPRIQEISKIRSKRTCLSIQKPAIWTDKQSGSFHGGSQASSRICSQARDPPSPVHRRLVGTNQQSSSEQGRYRLAHPLDEISGIQGQLYQIRPDSGENKGFFGGHSRPCQLSGEAIRHTSNDPSQTNKGIPFKTLSDCSQVANPVRSCDVLPASDGLRPSLGTTTEEMPGKTVVNVGPGSPHFSHLGSTCSGSSPLVGIPSEIPPGHPLGTIQGISRAIHGCVSDRLGSPFKRGNDLGRVDYEGDGFSHQSQGDDGGVQSYGHSSEKHSRLPPADCMRQSVSGILHKQRGGDGIKSTVSINREIPNINGGTECALQSEAHTRCSKYLCRSVVKKSDPSIHRVVTEPLCYNQDLAGVWNSSSGFVRYLSEQPSSGLYVPLPRPKSSGHRRVVPGLGRSERVCVPTVASAGEGGQEDKSNKLLSSTNCTILAQAELVHPSAGPVNRYSTVSSRQTRPAIPTRTESQIREPTEATPSRMAAIRSGFEAKGFSPKVAELATKAIRSSSAKQYDSQWNILTSWCSTRGINSTNPSLPEIAQFMTYLFEERQVSPGTIESYRSSLSGVLNHTTHLNIGQDPTLSQLIKAMYQLKPRKLHSIPNWDLALVLSALREAPFEPIYMTDIKFATLKTVFLVAIATGCRRSELHALARSSLVSLPNGEGIVLYPRAGFRSKNENRKNPDSIFTSVRIKALAPFLNNDDEDKRLCPVRAIKHYLARTKAAGLRDDRLFVSIQENRVIPISAPTVSRWIKDTVVIAYDNLNKDQKVFFRVKAHDTRAMATSLAKLNNIPMDSILKAARWSSQTTFINFYLRDLQVNADKLYSLGPIVAAQHICAPPSFTHSAQ